MWRPTGRVDSVTVLYLPQFIIGHCNEREEELLGRREQGGVPSVAAQHRDLRNGSTLYTVFRFDSVIERIVTCDYVQSIMNRARNIYCSRKKKYALHKHDLRSIFYRIPKINIRTTLQWLFGTCAVEYRSTKVHPYHRSIDATVPVPYPAARRPVPPGSPCRMRLFPHECHRRAPGGPAGKIEIR